MNVKNEKCSGRQTLAGKRPMLVDGGASVRVDFCAFELRGVAMFGGADALGGVDGVVAGEEVGDETGDREIDNVAGAKQFHGHDGAGQGGIGRACENSDETQGCEEIDGSVEEPGEGVAQRRADEKEWGDFAAFEAGTKRDGGEEQLPEPARGISTIGSKSRGDTHTQIIGSGDADAQVIACTQEKDQSDDDEAADKRTQIRQRDDGAKETLEAVGRLGEDDAHESKRDGCDDDLHHQPPLRHVMLRLRVDERSDVIGDVTHAPRSADIITDDGGEQTRDDRGITHAPNGEHFDGEDRTSERCTEDAAKARGDAGHEKRARVDAKEWTECFAEAAGDGAAHLHGCTFAAGGPAAQMRSECADEHERSHTQRHASAGLVNFIHDEVVTRFRFTAKDVVDPADGDAHDRQQVKEPRLLPPQMRHLVEQGEKQCTCRADQRCHGHDEQRHTHQIKPGAKMSAHRCSHVESSQTTTANMRHVYSRSTCMNLSDQKNDAVKFHRVMLWRLFCSAVTCRVYRSVYSCCWPFPEQPRCPLRVRWR